ncbi:DUF2628 domain-containing protein [Intestinirhabdus alba]|jgi:hypothetical protein|uniref:DUF2628 domain-containing protein n=1 Tax=Intestinirhabdus alba TaxID=2899544 RepID=A0A6L6IQ07_9ENTR|nr:DUF2628 domain-containing protein [Intestinirhabdus alba]MTH47596.1 DUF2628 domain-containing protein [Intestinirhabdus alba]
MSYNYREDSTLSEKWKTRFDFCEKHGFLDFWQLVPPKEYKEAFNKLPWLERIKVRFSLRAYVFGCIYLLCLGLWRKAILVFLLAILLSIPAMFLGRYGYIVGLVYSVFIAQNTIKWFYEKKVKGIDNWSL